MNQREFGLLIGVAQTTLSSYEKGVRKISYELGKQIAKVTKVHVEWLMDGTGPMSLEDRLVELVTEPGHEYLPNLRPVVSRITRDKYNVADVLYEREEPANESPSGSFYLRMPDNSLKAGDKSIKQDDLLLVDPDKRPFPGDLVAVATQGRMFIRYLEDVTTTALKLKGNITVLVSDLEAVYRVVRVVPVPFEV